MKRINSVRRYVWELSPEFDINHQPTGKFKFTIIDANDNSIYPFPEQFFRYGGGSITFDEIIDKLNSFCIELNTKYEDDLLYLTEVKKYARRNH